MTASQAFIEGLREATEVLLWIPIVALLVCLAILAFQLLADWDR